TRAGGRGGVGRRAKVVALPRRPGVAVRQGGPLSRRQGPGRGRHHRRGACALLKRRRFERVTDQVSYIRTDDELPPVAIIDRSPITTVHKIIFGIIAVIGAIAWAIIAFARGETVNAVWFVVAAICTYTIGFRFYARLIEMKIVRPRD